MGNTLEKKTLGKTGLAVSTLCFGTLALGPYHSKLTVDEGANLLAYAYHNGVNFWDTAELYETYPHINKALKILNKPDDLIIASRSYARTYEEMKKSIDKTLIDLNINSIPIFGLHELSGLDDFKESQGAISALKEAKEAGRIKYIAITMHSIEALKIATDQDCVDVVFPLYNKRGIGIKHGTTEEMSAAIKSAYEANKGVYAMKVLAGGHLSSQAEEAISFVLENPYVHSIAIGMDNTDEIEMNLALFQKQKEKIEFYKNRVKKYNKSIQVDPWCEGCGECIQICPNQAIRLEFSQARIDKNLCVLCGYCASKCKYFCLKVVNTR